RGRPLEMSPDTLLERIRARAVSGELFRVHLSEPALYARARRLFGSWARALAAAGLDHAAAVAAARRRSHEARRRRTPAGAGARIGPRCAPRRRNSGNFVTRP